MGDTIHSRVHKIVNGRNIATQIRRRRDFVYGIDLCDDVLFDILTRIPARILRSRMRYVSKKWFRIISDPVFVEAHLNLITRSGGMLIDKKYFYGRSQSKVTTVGSDRRVQSRFATDVRVLGSCNGLLLLLGLNAKDNGSYIDGRVEIFNPATGWLSTLPPLPLCSPRSTIMAHHVRGGIGFDPVTKQYKVAVFFCYFRKLITWQIPSTWDCYVLTVGCGSHWRLIHGLPAGSCRLHDYSPTSVLIDSSRLNWFVNTEHPHIVTIDITCWDGKCRSRIELNDIFGRIELNEEIIKEMMKGTGALFCFRRLMEMRGRLALWFWSTGTDIYIWAIDDKIWTKRIVIAYDQPSWPIGIFQTSRSSTCDEEFVVIVQCKRTLRGILYYAKDGKCGTVDHLTDFFSVDDNKDSGDCSAYAHVDSLVSFSATNY